MAHLWISTEVLHPLPQSLLIPYIHSHSHRAASIRVFVILTGKTGFSYKMVHFPPRIFKKEEEGGEGKERKSSVIEERSGVAKRRGGRGGEQESRHVFCQVVLLVRLILTNCAPSRVNLLFCCFFSDPPQSCNVLVAFPCPKNHIGM